MYLDRLVDVLAAKRTSTKEKKDKSTLKRLMEEKAARDEVRKQRLEKKKEVQKPKQKPTEKSVEKTKPAEVIKEQPADLKKAVAKIKAMKKPSLFMVNSNMSLMTDDPKEGRKHYQEFLVSVSNDDGIDIAEILNKCVNLSNKKGIHSWVCDAEYLDPLTVVAFSHNLEHFPNTTEERTKQITTLDLRTAKPFTQISLEDLPGIGNPSEVRASLHEAWAPIVEEIGLEKPQEKKEKEPKQSTPEAEPEAVEPEAEDKTEDKKPEEKDPEDIDLGDEDKPAEDAEGVEVEDAPRVNVGRLRSLRDPHCFILDPRTKTAEYVDFLGPDKPGETPKASKVLATKAVKFLTSRKLKKKMGKNEYPVIVYFLGGKDAEALKTELKIADRPHFSIGAVDKGLFSLDEPFMDFTLKVGNKTVKVDPIITAEMNKAWVDATSEVSGNPITAIQANTSVPIDFFRLVNKKQRPIEIYIGGQPEGAGYKNTIYVLASDIESNNFVKLVRRFKMPSLFYEGMSESSDIDAAFKKIKPEKITPANLLILVAENAFKPQDLMDVNKENEELAKSITGKITQLTMLHAFAHVNLKNKTKNPGSFVKNNFMVGTHIAQFNANMTICFLWGSHTQHVKVDPKEVMKQLPFVKQVITSYL
jgi:hypothetical protein